MYIPATPTAAPKEGERLVPVEEMEEWAQTAFEGMTHLNRIQSRIYDAAFNTNDNLLVCAPTGAGKTNIAMLAVLHEVRPRALPLTRPHFTNPYSVTLAAAAVDGG